MTDIDLDEIEVLASAATEGPWGHYLPRGGGWPNYDPIFGEKPGDEVALVKRPEDHLFIAAARTAVPALVARVRELEAQRDAVLALHRDEAGACAECSGFRSWPCATVRALTERSTT